MSVPYVAGDREMPEWWTAHDEAILRGELVKLAELAPVATPAPRPPRRTPWLWVILAWVVLLGWFALILTLGGAADRAPYRGPVATPTTYGPPPR